MEAPLSRIQDEFMVWVGRVLNTQKTKDDVNEVHVGSLRWSDLLVLYRQSMIDLRFIIPYLNSPLYSLISNYSLYLCLNVKCLLQQWCSCNSVYRISIISASHFKSSFTLFQIWLAMWIKLHWYLQEQIVGDSASETQPKFQALVLSLRSQPKFSA